MQLDAPKSGKKHFNPPYFYFAEKLKKLQPLGKLTILCELRQDVYFTFLATSRPIKSNDERPEQHSNF